MLDNAAGATLVLDANNGGANTIYNQGGSPLLQNEGTLSKTGSGAYTIDVPTTNSGAIDILAGRLNLYGGMDNSTGTITGASGTQLGLGGTLTSSTLLNVSVPQLVFGSAALTVNGPSPAW